MDNNKNNLYKNKKLLVLGSDFNTVNLVKRAKEESMYVVTADLMENSKTKELSDESWLISTTDIDDLEEKCIKENIDAIMFGASDFNIGNAIILCNRLNLPIYVKNDNARKVSTNKNIFKSLASKIGLPVAKDYSNIEIEIDKDLDDIKFPIVVKPSDSSGNSGMSYCYNREELYKAIEFAKDKSKSGEIIIERMLEGKEYNVHYYVRNGVANLLYYSSTFNQKGEAKNLYSFKTTSSHYLRQYINEVNDIAKKFIQEVGIKEGIAWFDVIRDKNDGKFYFLEMGHRFGGVMTYEPYKKVTDFDTIKWMLNTSIDESLNNSNFELNRAFRELASSYHLFSRKNTSIKRIEGLKELRKNPNIYIDLPKRENSNIRAYSTMGLIGIYSKDVEELIETIKFINNTIKVIDEDGENPIIYFDDYDTIMNEYTKGLEEFK